MGCFVFVNPLGAGVLGAEAAVSCKVSLGAAAIRVSNRWQQIMTDSSSSQIKP